MHAPVFKALFPAKAARYAGDSIFYKEEIVPHSSALVGCMAGEHKALEITLALKDKSCRPIVYSESPPSPFFLHLVQRMEDVSILFCPESMDEVRLCGEKTESGERYVSKAGQDKKAARELGQFIDLDSLSEMNTLLVFSIFEGLSIKEISSLTGRSESYVKTCLFRLKDRFKVLEKRELLVSLAKWISLGQKSGERIGSDHGSGHGSDHGSGHAGGHGSDHAYYENDYENYEESNIQKVLDYCAKPRSRTSIQNLLNIKSRRYLMEMIIRPLLEQGRLKRTIPEKPKSMNQRYVSH